MTDLGEVIRQEESVVGEAHEIPVHPTRIEGAKPRKKSLALWVVLGILAIIWILARPGVFTVQPIGALPEGITFVYYGRGTEMSFFSSPDGLCLQTQGEVSLLCRVAALNAAATELSDRIFLRLPYSHWAYLRSTGGFEFDR